MALGTSGGGGSAGAIQAGKANVKLGITDDVTPKLRELKEKFKEFGSETKKELAKAGRGNLFGEFFKGGAMGFGSSLASSVVEEIGKGIKEIIFGSKTLEDTTKAWDKSLKDVAETIQTIKTRFGEAAEDAPADMKRGVIDREITKLRAERERLEKEQGKIEGGLFKFRRATSSGTPLGTARTWAFWMGDQFGMTERVSSQEAKAVEGLEKYEDQIKKVTEDIRLLEREKKKLDENPQATALGEQLAKAREEAFFDERLADEETTDRTKQLIKLQNELWKIRGQSARENLEIGLKELENIVKIANAEEKAFKDKKKQAEELKKQAEEMKEFRKEADKAFAKSAQDIELDRLTRGLSPEDAKLARLVQQGLSNQQIMELRRFEQASRRGMGADFMSRGGLASSELARQIGFADSFQRLEKQFELSTGYLDVIRGHLEVFEKKLGFQR